MGTSVLSYSGVDIDTITGDDQAPTLSNYSEAPTEINGDWQGESSSSMTPQVTDMTPTYSSTDSSIDFTPEAPILMYSTSPALSNFEDGHNSTVGTIPLYSSDPTDAADVDTAIQASDVPDDSRSKGPVGQSESRHTEDRFYNENVAGVKAYWFDQDTGRLCNSVPARGLRTVYGDDDRYWNPSARPGGRWPEVACVREACWCHVSGEITCKLPAGVYTLSWLLQYEAGSSLRGLDLQKPAEFTLANTDGSQRTVSHRYLSNWPDVSDRQWELSNLTEVRLVEDNLFEYDAGEIRVSDEEEKLTSLEFSMVVPTKGVFLWKSGICLEGVVLRPSSITESTGRYFSVDEIGVAPVSAYSPLPTSTDEQPGIVNTAEPLVYTGSSDSTSEAPVLAYSPWPTSTDEQGIERTTSSTPVLGYSAWTDDESMPEAPVLGYSAWTDEGSMPEAPVLGYSAWTDDNSMPEAPVLGYSAWPKSTDEQGTVRTTSSVDSTHKAPVLVYSSSPTSTDGQEIVSTAEPLIYTSSIDSTPEAPVLAYSSSPTSTNGQEIVSTAEPLIYTSSIDSTHEAPVLAYSSSPTSIDGQGIVSTVEPLIYTVSSIDSTPKAPELAYSSSPTASTDDHGIVSTAEPLIYTVSSIDSTHEAPVLAYSSSPTSTDGQEIVSTAEPLIYTSSIDSTPEAPVLAYSSSPTSTDGQGIVSTVEPLVYTVSSIDSTHEAPVLMYSSSPAFQSNFENGQNTIGTTPFDSSDPTTAFDSMSLVDQDEPALPSSAATEHEILSRYSLISDSAGIENEEAPFYTPGADDSRSKGPVGQSASKHTEALLYADDDADVKVPFYTAPRGASDAGAQIKDLAVATSASTTLSSSNLTNSESFGASVDRDALELSAWLSIWNGESAENVTTETDPRWCHFENLSKDIVKGSDDWYYYTQYDCSTQTYHYPNGETEFIGTPATDSSISTRSHDDPGSASSFTAKPSFDGSIVNPSTCSTSAETPSAGSLDLPVPEQLLPCESGEQTFISGELILSTIDEWSRLPDVLVQQVLSLCGTLDLHRLRAVCKRWNSLICSPHCRQNYPHEDARYIIGRCFDQHVEDASHVDVDGRTRLVYTKVVGWNFYDLKEGRWYTWKPRRDPQHYNSNLVSEAGMIVLSGNTMAAANDHPLASEGGLVLCCSMLPGTATISELNIITNPMVMTKEVVLPLPVAWNNLYLSSFAVNLVVDSILSYKIFLINRYEDPFLCIFDSTINLWRTSSNPPVRAWGQAESVTFQGHLYVLCRAKEPPRRFWLLRYNYLEDSWADCGVNFPEWPDNGNDPCKELVVCSDRLFVISRDRLYLDTSNDRVIRMLEIDPISNRGPLTMFEIDLGDGTLVTESHVAELLFDAEGLKVDGQSFDFFDSQLREYVCVPVKSFEFHRAFTFGTSIVLTYRWLAFSVVYNVEACLWKLFPTDPNIELYGNVMPLRPP